MSTNERRGEPPLIITVAPTGARKSKDDHPAPPLTPDEIAAEAAACHDAEAAAFLAWLVDERIVPQYIEFSAAEVERYRKLAARGIIPGERQFLLFVLGGYAAGQTSAPRELSSFLAAHYGASPCGAAPGRAMP